MLKPHLEGSDRAVGIRRAKGHQNRVVRHGTLSFVFDRGVVVGTRGLGDDLMGSDVDAAIAAMPSGGNYARTLDF